MCRKSIRFQDSWTIHPSVSRYSGHKLLRFKAIRNLPDGT